MIKNVKDLLVQKYWSTGFKKVRVLQQIPFLWMLWDSITDYQVQVVIQFASYHTSVSKKLNIFLFFVQIMLEDLFFAVKILSKN